MNSILIASTSGKYYEMESIWDKVSQILKKEGMDVTYIRASNKEQFKLIKEALNQKKYVLLPGLPCTRKMGYFDKSIYEMEAKGEVIPISWNMESWINEFVLEKKRNFEVLYSNNEAVCSEIYSNTNLSSGVIPSAGIKSRKAKKWHKREISVLIPKGYLSSISQMKRIEMMPKEFSKLLKDMIKTIRKNPNCTVEQAFDKLMEIRNISITVEEKIEFLKEYGSMVSEYISRYYVEKWVVGLLRAGIEVNVVGENWQYFTYEKDVSILDNLSIHPMLKYRDMCEMMAKAKIVLNITPNLKAGVNLRTATALINGAYCISTPMSDVAGRLEKNKAFIAYNPNNIAGVVKCIGKLMANQEQSEANIEEMKEEQEQFSVEHLVEIIKKEVVGGK